MSLEIIEYITNEFETIKTKNKRYSLRAFAKKIGIEHSALSQILSKKRALTFENANKILSALKVEDSKKNTLLLTFVKTDNYKKAYSDEHTVTLAEEELDKIYEWTFYTVLSALEIKTIDNTVASLSQFLSLSEMELQNIVSILEKIGAIKIEKNKLFLTGNSYSTTNNVKSSALVKAHVNHIEKSIEFLKMQERPESDFSGITVATPKSKIPEAKRRIKDFRRSLASWLSDDA